MTQDWPVAELDPVRRMRVLAAATHGVAYAEKLIPAPFDAVWNLAGDLEHELPRMVTDLRSFEITSAWGERMTARARGRLGQHARFDVVLRPGWCVMQSRFVIGGMAAAPEGQATRFAFFGGLRLPGIRLLDPLLRPAIRPLALRPISRLEHRLQARLPDGAPLTICTTAQIGVIAVRGCLPQAAREAAARARKCATPL